MTWKRLPIPEAVRAEVLRRAKYCCEECGETPVELHRVTYYSQRPEHQYKFPKHAVEIFGFETADELLALCRECHRDKHIGPCDEFYADPEECAAEWEYFNHLMDSD